MRGSIGTDRFKRNRCRLAVMEVSAHRAMVGEFDKLSAGLAEGPENWMPGMFESPVGEIAELVADTPLGPLTRYGRFEVGVAHVSPAEVVVPITWHSLEAEPLFPVMKGRLHLYRLSDGTNRLEFEGRYEPPGGAFGRAADSAGLYPVAEATVQNFVERCARVLSRNALGRSASEQEAEGRLVREEEPWI